MKVSLNELIYLTKYRKGHTRYIFSLHKPRQTKRSIKSLAGSNIEGTRWNQDKMNNYTRYTMSIATTSHLCALCNTHTHDTHHLFNCIHIRTTLSPLDLWTYPAGVTAWLAKWTEKLAGGLQTGRSNRPPLPLARVMGVGRQQQPCPYNIC